MNEVKINCDCDECGVQFQLDSVSIKTTSMNLNEGKCDVVYFVCPSCKKVYLVSVNDSKYYDLKNDLEKQVMRLRKIRGSKNRELAKAIANMIEKKKDRLSHHVNKLKQKYKGRFTFVETDDTTEELKLLP